MKKYNWVTSLQCLVGFLGGAGAVLPVLRGLRCLGVEADADLLEAAARFECINLLGDLPVRLPCALWGAATASELPKFMGCEGQNEVAHLCRKKDSERTEVSMR